MRQSLNKLPWRETPLKLRDSSESIGRAVRSSILHGAFIFDAEWQEGEWHTGAVQLPYCDLTLTLFTLMQSLESRLPSETPLE